MPDRRPQFGARWGGFDAGLPPVASCSRCVRPRPSCNAPRIHVFSPHKGQGQTSARSLPLFDRPHVARSLPYSTEPVYSRSLSVSPQVLVGYEMLDCSGISRARGAAAQVRTLLVLQLYRPALCQYSTNPVSLALYLYLTDPVSLDVYPCSTNSGSLAL